MRVNRPLRDNEGALHEQPGTEARLEVAGTTPDIPGLYRDDLHPTCYRQGLDGQLDNGQQVAVTLVLGHTERLTATVPVQVFSGSGVDVRALRQLGCPKDGATRRCHGVAPDPRYMDIGIQSATHASCADAKAVMRSVGRWADSGRCYRTLCVQGHRMNDGYRCSVDVVGEAAWQITCRHGTRIVRGYTAE